MRLILPHSRHTVSGVAVLLHQHVWSSRCQQSMMPAFRTSRPQQISIHQAPRCAWLHASLCLGLMWYDCAGLGRSRAAMPSHPCSTATATPPALTGDLMRWVSHACRFPCRLGCGNVYVMHAR